MALRQRIQKKDTGCQAHTMPGRRNNPVNAGIPAQSVAAGKHSYTCNLNINDNAGPIGGFPDASTMNVPTYGMPITKHLHTCNVTMPLQNMSKCKLPANNPTSKISQQATLDVSVPSSLWRLQQHVSLDFDAHRQKVVPKRNQIAAAWRHLSPQLKWKKHERRVVADVFEVPPELFQLKDLKDILSLEAWKECLSLSERRFLRQLLPEGFDHGRLVRTLLRGDNFYFGSPLAIWGSQLLQGELHPDRAEQNEAELKQAYDEHYRGVQNYQEKMLETLGDLKEEWILCKSKKDKLSSKTRRRKGRKSVIDNAVEGSTSWKNSKRQKIATLQHASGMTELSPVKDTEDITIPLDSGIHSDGSTQFMNVLKVTRKQYDDILVLMGTADELSISTFSPLLNLQQKVEVGCTNGCDDEENIKTRKHWSELVVADMPAGHVAFIQRKAEKLRVSKLTTEHCAQVCSLFMIKEIQMDLRDHSNEILPSELEAPASGSQGSIEFCNNSRNLSASESSVTCLEGKTETQGPVDSCLSSVDSTQRVPSQNLIQEDQVSLIDLPHGSSLASEGQATLLSPVQAPRERTNFEEHHLFDGHERPLRGNGIIPQLETDTLSRYNEGFMARIGLLTNSLAPPEVDSSGKELANWDMHSKPASDVVSAAAASGESEEVDQRVTLQPRGGELDHHFYRFPVPSLAIPQETTQKEPKSGSKFLAYNKKGESTQHQALPEKILNLNIMGRSPQSVPSIEEVSHPEKVPANNSSRILEMDCNHVENESNNQMMLHLFMDEPKPHSNHFLSADASSNQGLQVKSSFCESNEVPSLTFHHVSDPMFRVHEPITELSLLVDDRTPKQPYHIEQAESVSSRTQNEYFQHCTMEPNWISRPSRQEEPVYPFRQHSQELHHLVQANQDVCSPISFSPMQPIWQQSAVGNASHPSFASCWNIDEHVDQANWIPSDATVGTIFLPGKDECGRPLVSQYWDQAAQGPCMNNQSTKHEHGFLRVNPQNLHDEHMYASLDNWARLQSQASSHLPGTWTMDKNARMPSHPWKNTPVLSSLQYEQQKLQNALLSKLNQNFTTPWH